MKYEDCLELIRELVGGNRVPTEEECHDIALVMHRLALDENDIDKLYVVWQGLQFSQAIVTALHAHVDLLMVWVALGKPDEHTDAVKERYEELKR